jgi:hypothetical protein
VKSKNFWAFALTGVAAYLLFTESGKNIASTLATGIEDIMTPRGIRNNNPGNIRHSATNWQGQSDSQTDADFLQFVSPEYGIRAIDKILSSYARRGLITLQDIISTWAPPSENDTQSYIAAVADATGMQPGDTVTIDLRPALIAAIIQHENGAQPYTIAQIDNAVSMA